MLERQLARWRILALSALFSLSLLMTGAVSGYGSDITLFLCGDVMTGRGIDQVLPQTSDPQLYESYVKDARVYVQIAERANGKIPYPVDYTYIWGDALEELGRVQPDLRIINLETSITTSSEYWPGKGINYRMHPQNIPILKQGKIDLCSLANNHTLDWGYAGLTETCEILSRESIRTAGAGANRQEAEKPAVLEVAGKGRVVVYALCSISSGVPPDWAAATDKPGVNLIRISSAETIRDLAEQAGRFSRKDDLLVVSIHWGDNWGYKIPEAYRRFAHKLIDQAGVDVVHGHSSHHARPVEVYKGKLILYGCGDFINDYEGIGGHEEYRDDLVLMYFPRFDTATGRLLDMQMTPLQIKRFRLQRASAADARWLSETLSRHSRDCGCRFTLGRDNRLSLEWD